jgi:hypothetical protein
MMIGIDGVIPSALEASKIKSLLSPQVFDHDNRRVKKRPSRGINRRALSAKELAMSRY